MAESASQKTHWGHFIVNGLLGLAGALCLAGGAVAFLDREIPAATLGFAAGLLMLLAATVDRFESVKGLGIEAKTRQLDRKLEEADKQLTQLRTLAELSGATLLLLASKAGRFDGAPTPREAVDLASRVRGILASVDASPATISSALKPFVRMMCIDISHALVGSAHVALTEAIGAARTRAVQLQAAGRNDDAQALLSSADQAEAWQTAGRQIMEHSGPRRLEELLRERFAALPLLAADVAAQLRNDAFSVADDLPALAETQTLRDPELWIRLIDAHRQQR